MIHGLASGRDRSISGGFSQAQETQYNPGVGSTVRVADLGSSGHEFEPLLAAALTPGEVDSPNHPSLVGKMSTSVLVIGTLHQRHSQ